MEETEIIRDRLWIWTHETGSHNEEYDIPKPSRMTPTEGACYLGTPNMMFIRYNDRPEMPFFQYAVPTRAMNRVVWSITGAGGATSRKETEHVLELARRQENITGLVMDDFFHTKEGRASIGVEELVELRGRMQLDDRRLDLYIILYDHWLDWNVQDHFDLCDKVIFWTWEAKNLERLEENFDRFELIARNRGKLLGCYLYDYGAKKPMPLQSMRMQCEKGRELLESGRIDGIVFLASNVCDLELEAVEWTRDWIADIGDRPLMHA